jgi:hypothetical protein
MNTPVKKGYRMGRAGFLIAPLGPACYKQKNREQAKAALPGATGLFSEFAAKEVFLCR